MLEISKRNARKLGVQTLLFQTQEECAELTKAISKFNRANGIGQITEMAADAAKSIMINEIADVSICIEQLVYMLGCSDQVKECRAAAFDKVSKRYSNVSDK